MFQTYILKLEVNGQYYIGSCKNIAARLKLHNAGKVKSTKRYIPWRKVYSEKFCALKEAVSRERQIKSWKKREAIERLIENL